MQSAYCDIKGVLEHRFWELASRLHTLTSRLFGLAGQDHHGFIAVKVECETVHTEVALSRSELQAHRAKHGC